MMKKLVISAIVIIGCGIILGGPLVAQAQYAPSQPPIYYQPFVAPQPYPQPPPPVVVVPPNSYGPSSGMYWGNPNSMYQYGLQLVYAKRYYEAIRVFDEFLRYYPQSNLADNALYWTGECYYALKQYPTALIYFQQIQSQYPRGNKVPDALLKIALSYFSMKQDARGCQILNDLMYRYPKSEPARKGYRWLNRCGWYPQSAPQYPQYPQYPHILSYPPSNSYGEPLYYDYDFDLSENFQ